MKSKSIVICLVAGLLFFSCKKNNDSNNNTPSHECNITLPTLMADANGSVTYTVSLQGNGKVDTLTYLGTDSVHVNSPTLPYKVVVPVVLGTGIGMKVEGSTSGGTITASYTFTSNGGNDSTTNSDSCGN